MIPKPSKNDFIGVSYPDFGYYDPLSYEIRDESGPTYQINSNGHSKESDKSYTLWNFMYNYI